MYCLYRPVQELVMGILDLVGLPYGMGWPRYLRIPRDSSLIGRMRCPCYPMPRAMFCMIMCCFASCSLNPVSDTQTGCAPALLLCPARAPQQANARGATQRPPRPAHVCPRRPPNRPNGQLPCTTSGHGVHNLNSHMANSNAAVAPVALALANS